MTYKALGSTNASESNIDKIQRAQNKTFRIITDSHKMSNIDHIYSKTKMIQIEDQLNLLSVQYLVQCLDTETVCHHITKMALPPREMKETIFTRHYQTVLPLLANNKKDTPQALHTSFVNTAIDNRKDNRVLNNRPHPSMTRKPSYRDDKGQLYHSSVPDIVCKLLNSYKK